jgi:hypothetical protein
MAQKRTMCFLLKAGAVSIALVAMSYSFARAEAVVELSYDSTLDMTRPNTILNIHARDHVTLVIKDDGSISEKSTARSGSARSYVNQRTWKDDTRLGRAWRVVSQDVLMRTGSLPHNDRIMTVTITGRTCRLQVVDRLKSGFTTYTFPRASDAKMVEFSRVTIGNTSCSIR